MKLLGNRVHVRRVKRAKASTDGGILLPDIALDDLNTGGPKEYEVLAVGPGRRNRSGDPVPVEFAPGDRVICQSYFTGAHEMPDGTFIISDDMIMLVVPRQHAPEATH